MQGGALSKYFCCYKGANSRTDASGGWTGRGVTAGASSPGCWTVTKVPGVSS